MEAEGTRAFLHSFATGSGLGLYIEVMFDFILVINWLSSVT